MKPKIAITLDWQEKGTFSSRRHYALREHYFDYIHAIGGIPVVTVTLLNYRADGSTFYNHIVISPIKDPESKEVKYFLGLTEEVATPYGRPELVPIPISDPEESES